MGINGILTGHMAGYETERLQNSVIEKLLQTDRAGLLAAGKIIDARAINRNSAMEAYRAQSACGARDIKPMYGDLPIHTERYDIEDATYENGVPAYEIIDKETGKALYIREDQLVIQRDEKSGMEFLINMDQLLSCNMLVTGELKNILNNLAAKRGFDLQEVPLQGSLTVNRDSRTGLNYLSIRGHEAKGVSVILASEKDVDTLDRLADEFMQYGAVKERSIAGLWGLLEISGNLKRESDGFTYLTPNGITYIPYDGDHAKAWEMDIAFSDYATARRHLALGIDAANYQSWLHEFSNAALYKEAMRSMSNYNISNTGSSYQYMV